MVEWARHGPAGGPVTAAQRRSDIRTVLKASVAALVVLGIAPFFLDIYIVNILIRALLLAALALTVDLLWGYTGILTFGQSAFFGIGAYACALVFTHWGFGVDWAILALVLGIVAAMAVAALAGWLAFYHGPPRSMAPSSPSRCRSSSHR